MTLSELENSKEKKDELIAMAKRRSDGVPITAVVGETGLPRETIKYYFRKNFVELYIDGVTVSVISRYSLVPRSQIATLLERAGLPRRRRFGKKRLAIINRCREGTDYNLSAIARDLNVSRQFVHEVRREYRRAVADIEGFFTYKPERKKCEK